MIRASIGASRQTFIFSSQIPAPQRGWNLRGKEKSLPFLGIIDVSRT
jgi:hypothetical protein